MWSIGIITYILLTGAPPFQGENLNDIYAEILRFNLVFEKDEWENISSDARDFVSKLIEPNIELRLSPVEALEHPWILNQSACLSMSINVQKQRYSGLKNQFEYKEQSLRVLNSMKSLQKLSTCKTCVRFMDSRNGDLLKRADPIKFNSS